MGLTRLGGKSTTEVETVSTATLASPAVESHQRPPSVFARRRDLVSAEQRPPSITWLSDAPLVNVQLFTAIFDYVDTANASYQVIAAVPPRRNPPGQAPALPDALAAYRPMNGATATSVSLLRGRGQLWTDRTDAREHWSEFLFGGDLAGAG